MKKILTLLSAFTITASSSATIVACNKGESPLEKTPPVLEGKTLEELKKMLDERHDLVFDSSNSLHSKAAHTWLVDKKLGEFVELKPAEENIKNEHWDLKADVSDDNKIKVFVELANFMQKAKESFDYYAAIFEVYEIEFWAWKLDEKFETEIKSKEKLVESINTDIKSHKELDIDIFFEEEIEPTIVNYLHKDAEKYAQKIIDRNNK